MFSHLFGLKQTKDIGNLDPVSTIHSSTIPLRAYQSFQEIHRLSINVFVHVIADSLTYGVLRSELSDFVVFSLLPWHRGSTPHILYPLTFIPNLMVSLLLTLFI